jgi:hypothetical protein
MSDAFEELWFVKPGQYAPKRAIYKRLPDGEPCDHLRVGTGRECSISREDRGAHKARSNHKQDTGNPFFRALQIMAAMRAN